METFTKLSSSLTESSVWATQPHTTRIVWITLLAMADRRGVVRASLPGLARRAVVTIDECREAIGTLSEPDEYSRTPDNEGRRIEQVEGGWVVLNHALYRGTRDLDVRRESDRERKRKQRASQRNDVPVDNRHVTSRDVRQCPPASAHAEAEAEADSSLREDFVGGAPTTPSPSAPRKKRGMSALEVKACTAVLAALSEERLALGVTKRLTAFAPSASTCTHILKRLREGVPVELLIDVVWAQAWAVRCPDRPDRPSWLTPATPFRDSNWGARVALVDEWRSADGSIPRKFANQMRAGDWRPNDGAM